MSSVASPVRQINYTQKNYPRNCWWVAARQDEVGNEPLGRWLLDSPVVLYRTEAGNVVALENRCLHRWAPISSGFRRGDNIVCGYHGAVFGPDGRCVRYPTQPSVPSAARVKSYPVIERTPFVWIWMGDTEQMTKVPEPPAFEWVNDPKWVVAQGYVEMAANYFLLHENVLDLTHFNYLHMKSLEMPDQAAPTFNQNGNEVSFTLVQDPYVVPNWQAQLRPGQMLRRETHGRFVTPALHKVEVKTTDRDAAGGNQLAYNINIVHCVTPESPGKTYYWYIMGQDHGHEPGAAEVLAQVLGKAAVEDRDMMQQVQEMMTKDERGMNVPEFSFAGDSGGIQARRVLLRLLQQEAGTAD